MSIVSAKTKTGKYEGDNIFIFEIKLRLILLKWAWSYHYTGFSGLDIQGVYQLIDKDLKK